MRLYDVFVAVDAEHLGAALHQLEGEGAAEPAEADHDDGLRLGDASRVVGPEQGESSQ